MKEVVFRGDIPLDLVSLKESLLLYLDVSNFPILICGNAKTSKSDSRFKTKVLLLIEPNSVLPDIYKSKELSSFDLVVAMSPWRAQRLGIPNWLYQPYNFISSKIDFKKRSSSPVLVAASKFGNSPRSLYWLRRKLIRMCDKKHLQLDVYGPDWNMSITKELRMRIYSIRQFLKHGNSPKWRDCFSMLGYKPHHYHGIIESKEKLLRQYAISIVIENDEDALSEKLFDCLQAGVVPVYVGPNLESLPFLESALIRADANPESIINILSSLDESLITIKQEAILDLHSNPKLLDDWSSSAVEKKFVEQISKFCQNRTFADRLVR